MRLRWASLVRLAFAHHPVCHPFRHDVFRVGRVHLCMGCWTMYPVALAVFGLLTLMALGGWWGWLVGGLAVSGIQGLSALGWTRTRPRRLAVKGVLGIGVGMALFGIFTAPLALGGRFALLLGCMVLAGLTMVPRARRLVRTCEGCFFKGDWERCPGMALVRSPDSSGPLLPAPRHPQRL